MAQKWQRLPSRGHFDINYDAYKHTARRATSPEYHGQEMSVMPAVLVQHRTLVGQYLLRTRQEEASLLR